MIRLQFDNHYEINVAKQQIAWVRSAEAIMVYLDVNIDHFREQKGVYIIKTPEEVIYVGKAKNLYNRLYEHCKEMMQERSSEIKQLKDKKWIDAFSPYRSHELIVEFIELENEVDRRWLESKLHHKYNTIFEHKKV